MEAVDTNTQLKEYEPIIDLIYSKYANRLQSYEYNPSTNNYKVTYIADNVLIEAEGKVLLNEVWEKSKTIYYKI